MERVLARRDLSDREHAFWHLIESSEGRDEATRRQTAEHVATILTYDEIHLASMVIALFQFYNAFVDINGVDSLSPEGYEASGVRLSTQGYAPPPMP